MNLLEELLAVLPSLNHSPDDGLYKLLKKIARQETLSLFSGNQPQSFQPFGELTFPHHSMGNVSTINLFDLEELVLFSFYWNNRHRYKKVVDIGANLGLHTIILTRCGYEVTAYEPDEVHHQLLVRNLALNECTANIRKCAVSNKNGTTEFIRVLNNTTASHINSSKVPYGPTESVIVDTLDFNEVTRDADLVKIDAEGHEVELILATNGPSWTKMDAIVEVNGLSNAERILTHLDYIGVPVYSQKINWGVAKKAEDMPLVCRDGSIFISSRHRPVWVTDETKTMDNHGV